MIISSLEVYDNWERLVNGVVKREELRQLAYCDSFSSTSTSFDATNVNVFVRRILAKPIQLTQEVIIAAGKAASFKQECAELKFKSNKLASLLHQAAHASNDLYERPMRRILNECERVLTKALSLVLKCRRNGLMKRMFTMTPAATAFQKISYLLDNSIRDLSWQLHLTGYDSSSDENEYLGIPPSSANKPTVCKIWEQIATLHTGNIDNRDAAAASLVSLARDNDWYGKLITDQEGQVGPPLKLVKEGKVEAAKAIGLLGKDPEESTVEHMIHAGVCDVSPGMLKQGPMMKVQAVVAWAVSELAANYPNCQNLFKRLNTIQVLITHLAYEIATYATIIASRAMVMDDPATKLYLNAMVARVLRDLTRQNVSISRTIVDLRALLRFAVLLERGRPKEVQHNSAMAMMEIIAVVEKYQELRNLLENLLKMDESC